MINESTTNDAFQPAEMMILRYKPISVKQEIFPTSPFTILEPHNPRIDEFHVIQERRASDFKAPKL